MRKNVRFEVLWRETSHCGDPRTKLLMRRRDPQIMDSSAVVTEGLGTTSELLEIEAERRNGIREGERLHSLNWKLKGRRTLQRKMGTTNMQFKTVETSGEERR